MTLSFCSNEYLQKKDKELAFNEYFLGVPSITLSSNLNEYLKLITALGYIFQVYKFFLTETKPTFDS